MPSSPGKLPAAAEQIIVFARPPRKGEVKTRLAARVGEDAAAKLYRAFLGDVVEQAVRLQPAGVVIALAPGRRQAGDRDEDERLLREALDAAVPIVPQVGDNLGQRMEHALRAALTRGARRAVILGTDAPTLPAEHVQRAFRELHECDIVFVPAADGGYCLVGAARVSADMFDDVRWGESAAFRESQQSVAAHGLTYRTTEAWYDVDVAEDLERLRRDASPAVCPRTAALLAADLAILGMP